MVAHSPSCPPERPLPPGAFLPAPLAGALHALPVAMLTAALRDGTLGTLPAPPLCAPDGTTLLVVVNGDDPVTAATPQPDRHVSLLISAPAPEHPSRTPTLLHAALRGWARDTHDPVLLRARWHQGLDPWFPAGPATARLLRIDVTSARWWLADGASGDWSVADTAAITPPDAWAEPTARITPRSELRAATRRSAGNGLAWWPD